MSFELLNQEQKTAVMAPEADVLVLAGAGSGKTRVLVERVAWLIQNGASPYEIACATFTRAAAAEMQRRLVDRVGARDARKVALSTLHGLGLRLVSRYGESIGLRSGNVSVYTQLETQALLEHEGEMLGLFVKGKWKHGKKALDCIFERMERYGEPCPEDSPWFPLVRAFESACRANNALPYYGLIHGLAAMAEMGKVREYTNWKYLLVDEAQDLDAMQWRALAAIQNHADNGELYAVGDLSQSIYGFRGAVPEYLQKMTDSGKLAVYELKSNYRSQPPIVAAANSLISHNKSHRALEMKPMRPNGCPCVDILENMDSAGLADSISRTFYAFPPTILCRNNRMLDKISSELSARGVKHRRIGKTTSALRGPLFVKANAFLKCCANPFDETAFLLAHKGLGINAETYAACRLEAAQSGKSAWQAWLACLDEEEHANIPGPETRVSEAKKLFAGGFYCFDPQDGAGAEFIEWLDSYTDQFPLANIGEYLYWLALVDVQDEIEPWDDSERMVTLMTCHASKGLEFPVVIVAGCNEGILPGKQAIKAGEAAIEDERRLMYVAVTRAKGLLQLAVRPVDKVVMETSGTQQAEPPSRFLKEMGIPQSSE